MEKANLGVLDVEREGRVLDLDGGDRVHGVRTAERVGGHFGETEMLDLALSVVMLVSVHSYSSRRRVLLDQLGHGTDGALDGSARVGALSRWSEDSNVCTKKQTYVQVVQVDVVGAQLLDRAVEGLAHVCGAAVDGRLANPAKLEAELRGEEDFLALARLGEPVIKC